MVHIHAQFIRACQQKRVKIRLYENQHKILFLLNNGSLLKMMTLVKLMKVDECENAAADIFVHRVNFSINLRNVLEVNFTSPLVHLPPHRRIHLTSPEVNEVAETVSVETTLRMFW